MELELEKIPCSWDEVTVQQYIDICNNQDKIKEDPLLFYAILFDISREALDQVEVYQFELAVSIIDQFKDTPIGGQVKDWFEFQGVKYVIPDNLELEKIGVYTDWLALVDKMKENVHEFIPGCLAMLCRPEGEVYNRAIARQRESAFHGLPISTAYVVSAFFLEKQNEYERSMEEAIRKLTNPPLKMKLQILCWRGLDFTQRFTTWLEGRLWRLKGYVSKRRWVRFITSWFMKSKGRP